MKAVEQPRVKDVLVANSAEPAPYTRAEFRKHVADEMRAWGEVVRTSGLKVE